MKKLAVCPRKWWGLKCDCDLCMKQKQQEAKRPEVETK